MPIFNLLDDYSNNLKKRFVGHKRDIKSRVIASYRDKRFFDGKREHGYGGYRYDGRWQKVAIKIIKKYKLTSKSKVLQIGCEKGFLIYELKKLIPNLKVVGLEESNYAIQNSKTEIKKFIINSNYTKINFQKNYFDVVIAIGVVYSFTLGEAIRIIKEINRVSKKAFINLASYDRKKDFWLFKDWSILGNLILKKQEWKFVLSHCNYKGDYYFTNAQTLNLKSK